MRATWQLVCFQEVAVSFQEATIRSWCREAVDGTTVMVSQGLGVKKFLAVCPARVARWGPGRRGPQHPGPETGSPIHSSVGGVRCVWPWCAVGDTARGDTSSGVARGRPAARGPSVRSARSRKVPCLTPSFCKFRIRGSERSPYGRTEGLDFTAPPLETRGDVPEDILCHRWGNVGLETDGRCASLLGGW